MVVIVNSFWLNVYHFTFKLQEYGGFMCFHIGGHNKVPERPCLCAFLCVFRKNILKQHNVKIFCFLDFNVAT